MQPLHSTDWKQIGIAFFPTRSKLFWWDILPDPTKDSHTLQPSAEIQQKPGLS